MTVVAFTGIAFLVFHVWAMIDMLRIPAGTWNNANQNQVVWALVILSLPVVGPALYILIARPRLVARGGTSSTEIS